MSAIPGMVRIGNAQAFWGDRCDAAAEMLAQSPDLDYLTMDYLAEVSMSILAVQRDRDPQAGYARDFVEVVTSLAPYWTSGGRCRLIVNAGGLNPTACAAACRQALEAAGCRPLRLAVVTGDDVLPLLKNESHHRNFCNLESGDDLSSVADQLVTANAYVGSMPIVEALHGGADIVITGRVADPSLTAACCIHAFGWSETDWNRLAGATVAGHLIECGTQVTGGIFTDWLTVPDPTHIGFPIVEVSADGSCVVTKPAGTGGLVNEWTVKEQLLYEIGDPASYLSPDVAVSFLTLSVKEVGQDRVQVTGATGCPRPSTLKVSATYRDGYRAAGTLTIVGDQSVEKADRSSDMVLSRVKEAGHKLRSYVVEFLGGGDWETVMRIAVESESKAAVERFSRELMPLITAGPPGTTGYAEGRPKVHPVIRYWPCLIDRAAVQSQVEWMTSSGPLAPAAGERVRERGRALPNPGFGSAQPGDPKPGESRAKIHPRQLRDIALARSGDKGTGSNIGVIARRPEDYAFLKEWLTADRVRKFFTADDVTSATRYELPNLGAFNFVLCGTLENSLQNDAQGKAFGQHLLAMKLNPSAPWVDGLTIGQVLRDAAKRFPDNEAFVFCQFGIRKTWEEVDHDVDQLARSLLALGLQPGDHFGVWATNVPEWVLFQFATARIGVVLVNVNPAYRANELGYALHQSDVRGLALIDSYRTTDFTAILSQVCPELAESQPGQLECPALPKLKWVVSLRGKTPAGMLSWRGLLDKAEAVSPEQLHAIEAAVQPGDAVNIQYTSGTSGRPKGAMLSHRNILLSAFYTGAFQKITEQDRICIPVPLYHCFGCVLGTLCCVIRGATMIFPAESFDAGATLKAIEQERATALYGVPTMFIAQLEHPDFPQRHLKSLRTGIMSGSPCPIEVLKKVTQEMGASEIVVGYGQTEASPLITLCHTDDPLELRVGTVGCAIPGIEVKIIDPESKQTLGDNQPGELCSRGHGVMLGYYNMPEKTAEAIDADGWLHTGDLAQRMPNGYFRITGRLKDLVIRGGENVYPREIEELLHTHPAVEDAYIVGVPDRKYGEELLAWVKLREGHTATSEELREFCKAALTHFKVPRYWKFVDSFPTTVTGKIQKFKIREQGIIDLNLQDAASIQTA